jgi:peptidoglycan/xylan/chitin deacetylase (PgdA/CDA1 family)
MSRRVITALFVFLAVLPSRAATRSVAITFDDLPDITADEDTLAQQQQMTTNLLASIVRQRVPAIGFVNEDKLIGDDSGPDPRRAHLVEEWLDAGLEIGNHTYSHVDLHAVEPDAFENDILRGESTIRGMVERHGLKLQWFRHPYLDCGKSVEVRDRIDQFLADHGYRVAPVTIDDSEWIYELAYRKASALRRPFIRNSYIRYMRGRFAWDEERSRIVFGREIPQVLLLHAGALNADAFDSLAKMIRERGYEFVSIESAVADPAYMTPEQWTEGGVSWLERWGVARGIPDDRFTHDPKVPPWIQRLAGAKDE